MKMLCVDTATEVCGIGLAVDGRCELEVMLTSGLTHTKVLMEGIQTAMALLGWETTELDAVAVTRGPGSFTGLRIGISAVKGLAFALGKPLIGVSSLEVLAHQAPDGYPVVCPIIDARRKEVYWSLFHRTDQGLQRVCEERAGAAADAAGQAADRCFFIGNGALLYAKELKARCPDAGFAGAAELNMPRPAVVARLAGRRMAAGLIEDVRSFRPVYLRKSDAEIGR